MEAQREFLFLAHIRKGSYQGAPHNIKLRMLCQQLRRLKPAIFVETGTYFGDTLAGVKDLCERAISIEVEPNLYARARARFANCPNVELLCGDVLDLLPRVLASLNDAAVFWLDAHYSGGVTGCGMVEDPILESLALLGQGANPGHRILIDDARAFDGNNGRPDLVQVLRAVKRLDSRYVLRIQNDIITAELPLARA